MLNAKGLFLNKSNIVFIVASFSHDIKRGVPNLLPPTGKLHGVSMLNPWDFFGKELMLYSLFISGLVNILNTNFI